MPIESIFKTELPIVKGVYLASDNSDLENQSQINEVYFEKWTNYISGVELIIDPIHLEEVCKNLFFKRQK